MKERKSEKKLENPGTEKENINSITDAICKQVSEISGIKKVSFYKNPTILDKEFSKKLAIQHNNLYLGEIHLNVNNLKKFSLQLENVKRILNLSAVFLYNSIDRKDSYNDKITELENKINILKHQNDILNVELNSVKESAAQYKNLIDFSSEAILLRDADSGLFIDANPSAEKLFGYKKDFLLKCKPENLYVKEQSYSKSIEESVKENSRKALSGIEVIFERNIKTANGETKICEVRLVCIPSFSKNLIRSTYIDITKRKKAENELLEFQEVLKKRNIDLFISKKKAEESDKLKSAFLANISHEIRTPINGIIGFSKMLVASDLSEEKKKRYSETIINNSNKLLSIINDILDISRLETGKVHIYEDKVNINEIIDDLYALYHPQLVNKNISFSFSKTLDNQKSVIITDKKRLYQVFNYLINNAVKFTCSGHIKFGYTLNNNLLHFFIEDSGIGIPEYMQKTIFESFWQVETETVKQYGGTGLGLSISKKLVNILGGDIWLESTINRGSTFFFTLPYKTN